MKTDMYISDRTFKIWSYTVSHSTLFIRSDEWKEDDKGNLIENNTIDIEFWDVSYIDLPQKMDGIQLKNILIGYPEKLSDYLIYDRKVIQFKSGGKEFYVVAHGCVIGKSNWFHDQGRFENFNLSYPEILFKI